MHISDAYRLLGVAPGATEPEGRWGHDQAQMPWHGDRHAHDPNAAQYAYARRAELALALDMIHRAGFPDPAGKPRVLNVPHGTELPWQPHHGPLPMPAVAPPQTLDAERAHKRSQGVKKLLGGIGLIALGAIVTGVTHQAAVDSGGGTYVVAYGPIIVGVVMLFQGLFGVLAA